MQSRDVHPDLWSYIRRLEGRLRHLESIKCDERLQKLQSIADKGQSESLFVQFAHKVTGIIGIREIANNRHWHSKLIWLLLLSVGISATVFFTYEATLEYLGEPTATKVKLNGSVNYDSPAIAICPAQWVDVTKASKLGLTPNALKYSLGYTGIHPYLSPSDIERGRSDFYTLYKDRNFSSLVNYYKGITIDIENVALFEDFQNAPAAIRISDLNSPFIGLFYVHYQICNVYELHTLRRRLSQPPRIRVKLVTKSEGIDSTAPGLWIHFKNDLNMLLSPFSQIFLSAFTRSKIIVSATKFVSLTKPEARCLTFDEAGSNYSEATCACKCRNRRLKELIQVGMFQNSFVSDFLSPWDTANYMDLVMNNSMTVSKFMGTKAAAIIHSECDEECPPACNKAIYQLNVQWQQILSDSELIAAGMINVTQRNMSYFEVLFEHTARHSGVITFLEVVTYSFTSLVTSIGGTLGLFVGATLMTFAQVIFFFIDYARTRMRCGREDDTLRGAYCSCV